MNHVRADRWYKLGRTILYGRLEDEAPFQSVRRLVEYEDYALRLLRDVGIPTATPYGIVEMTPEREYLLVTEFFDGARGDRRRRGRRRHHRPGPAAHPPAVGRRARAPRHQAREPARARRPGVGSSTSFFVQVRPSPWRQAVDLANMMLVLAVRTDADRVYERALHYFTPDEIAEAFAAARGVASPTQLRTVMKQDGRDLLAQFRALAPERRPISLQRWSVGGSCSPSALALGALVVVPTVDRACSRPAHDLRGRPAARAAARSDLMILMAQSVPSATSVPCVASLPAGWDLGGVRDRARTWRASGSTPIAGGDRAVEVTLLPPDECDVEGATRGAERRGRACGASSVPEQLPPDLRSTRYYLFPGGCVTYEFEFDRRTHRVADLRRRQRAGVPASRTTLVREVREQQRAALCAAPAHRPCS